VTKRGNWESELSEAPVKDEPSRLLVNDDVMTLREVAEYLRIHQTTLYRLIKRGKIPAFRVGSDWRFNREQINRWMAQQQNPIGR